MDREDLLHLCALARLDLDQAELEAFEGKFNSMLSFTQKVLAYEPAGDAEPLTLIDKLELRRDVARDFEWPEQTVHDYQVPTVIDFEAGGEG
ncbi:hypothetical protein IT575_04145 [bacterium]|nr:hypothetical protein [bacterium]